MASRRPAILTHYYRPFSRPLRSLSAVLPSRRAAILEGLALHEPLPFRLTRDDYLPERLRIEACMRSQLVEQGGRPEIAHPHYFVLGTFSMWESDGSCKVEVALDGIPEEALSFTMTDSFFNYRERNLHGTPIPKRDYHRSLYRLSSLDEALDRYGLPTDAWRTDAARRFEVYVEAQVWTDRPLAHLLE